MEKKDFYEVNIEELISYSKQKEVPAVTIIDNVSEEEFKYVDLISERLKLRPIIVANTNMIAFIGNSNISQKLARDLHKKSQIMYYDFAKRPRGSITIFALTGYTNRWDILRENGSIIMCEHNYMNNFNRLGELINGDIIEIKTNYGDFYYSVYDNQIVQENETEKLPIQQGEKLLMIYTCYPFNSVGDTEYRLVVYCRKI